MGVLNMNKVVVIAVVGILLVAGLVFLVPSGEGGGDSGIDGEMTITVTEMETGVEYETTTDIGDLTMVEQMMLAFGQGVRKSDVRPLADFTGDAPGLKGAYQYKVVLTASITLSGSNIDTLSTNSVAFYGCVLGGFYVFHASTVGAQTLPESNAYDNHNSVLTIGSAASVSSKGFAWKSTPDSSAKFTGVVTALTGNDIANSGGIYFTCKVTASGVDYNGNTITASKTVNLKLTGSLTESGTMSVAVSSMSSSVTQLSMLHVDSAMSAMEMAKV
jgi:hypothetical protein